MGKPIAGREQFPFGVDGIVVSAAVLEDGTKLKNLTITKQRSVNVYDLKDETGKVHQFLKITAKGKDGKLLPVGAKDDVLLDKLKPGFFCVRAKDRSCDEHGYIIRFALNRVTLGDGVLYDIDLGTECTPDIILVTDVKLDKNTLDMAVGESANLAATVLPENATNKTVKWESSDTSIVAVTKSGKLTAKAQGSATITVTTVDGEKTDTCTITVIVHKIILDEDEIVLEVGQEHEITYSTDPVSYTPEEIKVVSSEPATVSVTNKTLHAVKKGTVTVTVSDAKNSSVSSTCQVKVTSLVKTLTLNKERLDMFVGDTEQLIATVLPADADDKSLTWVANGGHATVSESGLVTATSPGLSNVFVSTNDGSLLIEQVVIEVKEKPVENTVAFKDKTLSLDVGSSKELEYVVTPPDYVSEYTMTSSNKGAVVVNSGNTVTAVGSGTSTITITDKNNANAKDTCVVTAIQKVTGINVDKESISVEETKAIKLNATVVPSDANNKTLKWTSSDAKIATVDSTGRVLGMKAGTCDINVESTDGSNIKKVVSCTVTALVVLPETITLNPSSSLMEVNDVLDIVAEFQPNNTTDKELTWTSSDDSKVKVVSPGKIQALAPTPTAVTITAVSGNGKKGTSTITVKAPPAIVEESIKVVPATLTLKKGETFQLEVEFTPENTTDKTVSWVSDKLGAVGIDGDGKITANDIDTGTITATSKNGKTSTCVVTIIAAE